jgi:Na+-transporting methylmalonyl-CoA/oxaloacetate decarboxylase gamma subunit
MINMKSVKTKLSWLFILACCMQILTASTGATATENKSRPSQTKQTKAKKSNKSKGQMPLFKSLLNHL